jgi:hypothetical protein
MIWPCDLSKFEFYEKSVEDNPFQNDEDKSLMSLTLKEFEKQSIEDNPFPFMDFDVRDDKDDCNLDVEDLVGVVDSQNFIEAIHEHLV